MRRYAVWIGAALACCALSACMALRFGYNHGDSFLTIYADRYLDLDETQERGLRDALNKIIAWHRTHELPVYGRELSEVRSGVAAGRVRVRDVAAFDDAVRASVQRTLKFAAPLLVDSIRGLTPEQIEFFKRKLDKANREFKSEYLSGTEAEQRKARSNKLIEQFERWYGRLDDAQRDRLRALSDARPYDNALWWAERQRRQALLLSLIDEVKAKKPNAEQAANLIERYLNEFEQAPRADARAWTERMHASTYALVVEMANKVVDDEQRQRAAERIQRWIDDFRALQNDRG